MTTIRIAIKSRRWDFLWRRLFSFQVPESWSEVPLRLRARAYVLAFVGRDVRDLLLRGIGRRWFAPRLPDDARQQVRTWLDWAEWKPTCDEVFFPKYKGLVGPLPNGANMTCGEFMVADLWYGKLMKTQDPALVERLTLLLWRRADRNQAAALARGDQRVAFVHDAQIHAERKRWKQVPAPLQANALAYMGGLKLHLVAVYGDYIFNVPAPADEDEVPLEEADEPPAPDGEPSGGPDFGWLGVLQQVADSGPFGNIQQVYQANLHEVCIWLVQKTVERRRTEAALAKQKAKA